MFKIVLFTLSALCFAFTSQAQSKPQEKTEAETTKTKPSGSDTKTEKSIDLDAFFKKGEEKAGTSSCDKPEKPADPMA